VRSLPPTEQGNSRLVIRSGPATGPASGAVLPTSTWTLHTERDAELSVLNLAYETVLTSRCRIS